MNPKVRKVVDHIKHRNIQDNSINNSALLGLGRIRNIISKGLKFTIFGSIGFLCFGTYYQSVIHANTAGKASFLSQLENLPNKKNIYQKGHFNLMLDYLNKNQIDKSENKAGITLERFKLMDKAEGLVLETCCCPLRNNFYLDNDKTKITSHIGIDWNNEALEYALASCRNNQRLMKMDATNIEFNDDTFDTVIDTFGLQSSHDYKQQYDEMKRVCKKGGKILLMEFGESLWKNTNYKMLKQASHELTHKGQVLFYNYDDLIVNDPEVKVLKRKRKINGRLFVYYLEKI